MRSGLVLEEAPGEAGLEIPERRVWCKRLPLNACYLRVCSLGAGLQDSSEVCVSWEMSFHFSFQVFEIVNSRELRAFS